MQTYTVLFFIYIYLCAPKTLVCVFDYSKGISSLKKMVLNNKKQQKVLNRKLWDNLVGDFLCPVVGMGCQPLEVTLLSQLK